MFRNKIAVLITVHNRREHTLNCLKALFQQNGTDSDFSISVYLTDDGCTDGTKEAVQSSFPQVKIIMGDGTLFWNRGMYAAWKEAVKTDQYDYYLWLNDDTTLFPSCISTLVSTHDCQPYECIVIGTTCDSLTQSIPTYGGNDSKGRILFNKTESIECDTFNGNIVLIPHPVFKVVGFNNPYYRHSTGDTEYGILARKNNFRNILACGFQGICDIHDHKPIWKDSGYRLCERWKDMMKPTGANPIEYFHFRRENDGVFPAIATLISNFIHLLFPTFWE